LSRVQHVEAHLLGIRGIGVLRWFGSNDVLGVNGQAES
jgi:hypothetical protein